MQLINTDLDNSLAASWEASDNITLSTNQFSLNSGITIYPNPLNDFVNINAKENIENIIIYDVSGKIVKTFQVNATQTQLNLSSLANGFYFMKISSNTGFKLEKIIKQ